MPLIHYWLAHRGELGVLFQQHLLLVGISTGFAIAVGVPAGILAARHPRTGRAILAAASIAQTIPSLALLGFLLPLPIVGGIGPRTALVALFLYALLPIVRSTATGLQQVDAAVVEAGVAVGMTSRQLLYLVELPLALPAIITGVRIAAVIGVGTATVAAAVGAGGLGEYIFRGLAMVDTTTILAGAVPAAALALTVDGLLSLLGQRLGRDSKTRGLRVAAVASLILLVVAALWSSISTRSDATIVVGSKNFTEQVILGEMVAQRLEAEGLTVVRKLNLGGTFVCDRGIRTGDLDVYVEYTGTAVSAVFKEEVPHDSTQALERAKALYAAANLTVMPPLGFNNTFTILVRSSDAETMKLRTVDDLKPLAGRWTPGFGYEFLAREDGYAGLIGAYGLTFAQQPKGMDLSLIYRALAEGQVDVIAGDATSAQIDQFHLTALEDTRAYFPPYDAVPIVRTATVLRQPAVGRALSAMAGSVSAADMRALNAAVDIEHRDVAQSVRDFLARAKPSAPAPGQN
jgi:osmoprotectant transport system permease protein